MISEQYYRYKTGLVTKDPYTLGTIALEPLEMVFPLLQESAQVKIFESYCFEYVTRLLNYMKFRLFKEESSGHLAYAT